MSEKVSIVKVVVPDILDQLSEDLKQELIDKQFICVSKLHSNCNEFNELKDEIKRLKSDLLFANKCMNTLNKFKKYLNEIRFKFESLLDQKERLELNSLEVEYNLMIQKIKDKVKNRSKFGTDCLNDVEEDNGMTIDYDSNGSDYDTRGDISAESSSDEELTEEKPKLIKTKVKSNEENNRNSINAKKIVFKYKCEDCYYRTNYDNLWQNHRKSHLEGVVAKCRDLFCEVCDKQFKNSREMLSHFYMKHPGYWYGFKQIECLFPGCNATFSKNSDKYRQHMKRHLTENNCQPFICGPDCQFSSEDYNMLRRHQFKVHSAPEERKQVCEEPGCGQRFYYLEGLKVHRRTHLLKSFWCNRCTNSYKYKRHLKEHLIKQHNAYDDVHDMDQYLCDDQKMKSFFCYECQTQFRNSIGLERHKRREHPIDNKNGVESIDVNGSTSEDVMVSNSSEFMNEIEVIDENIANNQNESTFTEDVCKKSVNNTLVTAVKTIEETDRLVVDNSCDTNQEPVLKRQRNDNQFDETSEVLLDSHRKAHQNQEVVDYVCKECQFQSFQSLSKYDKHNREVHKRVDKFECPFPGCSSVLNGLYGGLRRHMNQHLLALNVKHFTCDQNSCDFRSKVYNDLIRHQFKVHNKHFDTFKCQVTGCGRVFFSNIQLSKHKRSHNKRKNSPFFRCGFDDCKYFCRSEDKMIRHKIIHTNPKPLFNCNYDNCPFEGYSDSQIKDHVNEHPVHELHRPYECPICPKKFNKRGTVTQHIVLHFDFKGHKCEYKGCNETFHTASQRIKHTNVVHKMIVQRFPCDWPECGFIGKTNNILIHHKYRHTGELPYACNWPECGKRFRTPSTYKTHMRLHTNDRCYKCEWPGCDFDTHDRGALRFHKMRHQRQLNETDGFERPLKVVFKPTLPKKCSVKRNVRKPKRYDSDSDFSESD